MNRWLCVWIAAAAGIAAAQEELTRETINKREPGKPALETWYKITQKIQGREEQIGFAHEVIDEDQASARYSYRYVLEAEVYTPSQYISVSLLMEGELNSLFDIVQLSGRYTEGAAEVEFRYDTTDTTKTLMVGSKAWDIPKDQTVHFTTALSALILRQKGAFGKAGRSTSVKFWHPKAEDIMNRADVEFQVRAHVEVDKFEGGKTKVSEVVIKGYPVTTKELVHSKILVDRYGRAVRVDTEAGFQISIAKTREEAIGSGATKPSQGHRDPFRKDLVMHLRAKKDPRKKDPIGTGGTGEKPVVDPLAEMKELQKLAASLLAPGADQKLENAPIYKDFIAKYGGLKATLRDPKSQEFRDLIKLKRDVEANYKGAMKLVETEVLGLRSDIVEMAKNDDLEPMKAKLKEMEKLRQRLEFDEAVPAQKAWETHFSESEVLVVTTQVRLEFTAILKTKIALVGTSIGREDVPQKVELELQVLGHKIRVRESVPFMVSTTFARIKLDKYESEYRTGDMVQVDDKVKLKIVEISRYGVTLSWPEHKRPRPSNQKEEITIPEQLGEVGLGKLK